MHGRGSRSRSWTKKLLNWIVVNYRSIRRDCEVIGNISAADGVEVIVEGKGILGELYQSAVGRYKGRLAAKLPDRENSDQSKKGSEHRDRFSVTLPRTPRRSVVYSFVGHHCSHEQDHASASLKYDDGTQVSRTKHHGVASWLRVF